MKFHIDEKIFATFPDLSLGVVVARNIDNKSGNILTQSVLQQEAEYARALFSAMKVSDHEHVKAWRKAYTTFGAGSDYRSSVEALLKRVTKDKPLPAINPLVDIYNAISIKHVVPVGGEDLKYVKGDIKLTFAQGDEPFIALGETEKTNPEQGEVVYIDGDREVLCRRWNWRESDKTKLTEDTTEAVFMMEGLSPVNTIELKEAVLDLAAKIEKFCQATTEMYLLTPDVPTINF